MSIKELLSKQLSFISLLIFFLATILLPVIFISFSENAFVGIIAVFVLLVLLLASYRWPWVLITFLILAPSNFFHLLDISFLPSINIAQGIRVNFIDILILCIFVIGMAHSIAHQIFPLFRREIILIFASLGLSLIWGLSQDYIDIDVAFGGLRQWFAFVFYISLISFIYLNQNKQYLIRILIGIVIISIGIQLYEVSTGARLVLSTSTTWFYNETKFLPVGNLKVAYLWNRTPAILFLVYHICLARWFLVKRKKFLLLAAAIFIFIALTLIRSMLILICLGSLFLTACVYFTYSRSRALVFTSMFFTISLGILLILFGIATNSVRITRLATLLNPSEDGSFNVRLQTTQIFYEYFLESPLVGHGPGSIGLIEKKHGVWSTDVGFISSLAGYGLLTFFSICFLIARVFKSIKYALRFEKSTLEVADIYGISGFFFVTIVSSLTVQDYFFKSPWNFSTAMALVILDVIVRNTRRNMFFIQHIHPENEN